MKPTILVTSIILAGLVFSGINCHRHHHGLNEKSKERILRHITRKLDLADEQQTKMKVVIDTVFEKMKPMKSGHITSTDELIRQFEADTFNDKAVRKNMSDMEKNMKELHDAITASLADVHKFLNPEQRKKAAELLKKHRTRFTDK